MLLVFFLGLWAQEESQAQTILGTRRYFLGESDETPLEEPVFSPDSTIIYPRIYTDSSRFSVEDNQSLFAQVVRVFSKNLDSIGAVFVQQFSRFAPTTFSSSKQLVTLRNSWLLPTFRNITGYALQRGDGSIIDTGRIPYDSTAMRGVPRLSYQNAIPIGNKWLLPSLTNTIAVRPYVCALLLDSTFRNIISFTVDSTRSAASPQFFLDVQPIERKRTRILFTPDGTTVSYLELDSTGRRVTPYYVLPAPWPALFGRNWLLSSPDGNGTYLFQTRQVTWITRFDSLNQQMWRDSVSYETGKPKLFVDGGYALTSVGRNFFVRYDANRREMFRVNLFLAAYGYDRTNPSPNNLVNSCYDKDGTAYVFNQEWFPGSLRGSRRDFYEQYVVKIGGFGREYTPWVPLSTAERQRAMAPPAISYTITPNPVRKTFVLNGQAIADETEITLIDLQGRPVKTQVVKGLDPVDVSTLPAAMYQYVLRPLSGQQLKQASGKLLVGE